jgi:streptomycin 6-kinase
MLLELIDPGEHPTAAPAEAVAALLDVLHVSTDDRLPTLEAVVRVRVDTAFEDGRASARKAAWAHARIDQLVRTAARQTLLHGDLDERNLLVCGQRGLCAIDPLPCVGDPAYDAGYWVHGNRRSGRRARLDAIVAATGFDRERVRDWAAVVGVHG